VSVAGQLKASSDVFFCDSTRLVFPGRVSPNDAVVVNSPGTASVLGPNYCAQPPPCQPGPIAFTPVSARIGATVYVVGCGFSAGTVYQVRIGNSSTPAIALSEQILRFAVPIGASSGRITVLVNNAPLGQPPARFFRVER
jgi:hypothetical protein